MATQVTFDKPYGFITVIDGSRKWVISKEEAKNVSVTVDETRTAKEDMGTLVTSLITLVPAERGRKIKYKVKIVKESGEEVELFGGGDVDLAYDMVNRITDFTKRGTKEEISLEERAAGGLKTHKKSASKAAGILEIICCPFVFLTLLYGYYGFSYEGYYEINDGYGLIIIISIVAIIALLPVVGGICALIRKKWRLALTGSIVSLIFWILGIPALILVIMSKDDFKCS